MRHIVVIAYDPAWPEMFAAEKAQLLRLISSEAAAIHHIGSTSVPGLAAKPIIDILIEAREIEALDRAIQKMAALGYLAKGEFGIPGRRFFVKGGDDPTRHVHAFESGHPEVARHLAFRDYLIAHPDEARAYAELKSGLARQFPHDIASYMQGKDAFIKAIDQKTKAARSLGAMGNQDLAIRS